MILAERPEDGYRFFRTRAGKAVHIAGSSHSPGAPSDTDGLAASMMARLLALCGAESIPFYETGDFGVVFDFGDNDFCARCIQASPGSGLDVFTWLNEEGR